MQRPASRANSFPTIADEQVGRLRHVAKGHFLACSGWLSRFGDRHSNHAAKDDSGYKSTKNMNFSI